ncbi:helix-turn-helix transcriptional regulator [Specibacter cremeus]|uniref:helix-turn-helix transcriptional regulator n=1 Tax=Specibacter cremeus TaxID=1629051 RepID=UPI000F76B511|nr:helix-turn-helix domain-containing protein [Specibacter cremeus]
MSAETDYAVPPGEFLRDWLEETGTTQQGLADDLGVSRKHVNTLLAGASLSPEIAAKLALVTGYSARWWMKIESQYRADKARIAQEQRLAESAADISPKVTTYLRAQGFIHNTMKNPGAMVAEVLAFYGVATKDALFARFQRPAAAFRQQLVHDVDWQAVSAWLRVGELEFKDAQAGLPAYDAARFREMAASLPQLSTGDPADYQHQVTERLRSVGVAVVFVPEVPGCRAHGVTRWIKNHPVIQLSGRGKRDDEFWFSLMHEVHHVLEDPHEDLLLQGPADTKDDPREMAADAYAATALIPPGFVGRLVHTVSLRDVETLAADIGIAPGIVVGRLQHDAIKSFNWGNGLKKQVVGMM